VNYLLNLALWNPKVSSTRYIWFISGLILRV